MQTAWTQWILTGICIVVMTPAAWAQQGGRQLGNFRVPEYDEKGVKKSTLTGESAVVRPDGNVDIGNLRIEFYEADGKTVRMAVTAPACSYNQSDRIAKSPTSVRIEGEKMVVTGEDFAWDGQKEIFKIFKDAKVVIKGGRKTVSEKTATSESSE